MGAQPKKKIKKALEPVEANVVEVDADPAVEAARKQVRDWTEQAKAAYPERESIIDALMVCAVAMSNIIMYGPPGTAKSALARALTDAIQGTVFDLLFTRYTTPAEVNGPTDVQALKQGHMKRVTDGFLPKAQVAFFDEGFKANSACLNSLLTAVNEHKYHEDGKVHDIPLRVAILASNEFPDDNDNLGAFDDRFPMRFEVKPLQNPDNFKKMLCGDLPKVTAKIDVNSLELLRKESESLEVGEDAVSAMWDLRGKLIEQGVYVSDRKLAIATNLLRARAAIIGTAKVSSAHIGLLEHVLWLRPDQKGVVRELVRDHVATWLRDLRSAIDIIDEQENAMAQAIKGKGNISATSNAITNVGQKLKNLNKEVLKDLEAVPEAADDVERLRGRIESILKQGREALQVLM